jgi:mannosyltransferase OCH1-like enzyme
MIVFINRLLKFSGGIVKGIGYIFHFFFPKKRFTLPKYSKAKIKSKEDYTISKIVWQTNFTQKVTLPVYINYLVIRLMSLDYDYHYVSTEDREKFIKRYASEEFVRAFLRLNDGAAQADFWRVFVLNTKGGVYLDIDAHPVWPLSKMIKKDDEELILKNKQHYTNYFMASAPKNPILEKTLELMVDNINNNRIEKGVYFLTGPEVLNQAIGDKKPNSRFYRVTCVQGSFTNEYFQYIDRPKSKWTYKDNRTLLKSKKEDS